MRTPSATSPDAALDDRPRPWYVRWLSPADSVVTEELYFVRLSTRESPCCVPHSASLALGSPLKLDGSLRHEDLKLQPKCRTTSPPI